MDMYEIVTLCNTDEVLANAVNNKFSSPSTVTVFDLYLLHGVVKTLSKINQFEF